jgi:hypothetical protein
MPSHDVRRTRPQEDGATTAAVTPLRLRPVTLRAVAFVRLTAGTAAMMAPPYPA